MPSGSPRLWDESDNEDEWKPSKMTGNDLIPLAKQCVNSIQDMKRITMQQFWTDYGSGIIKEKIRNVLGNLSRGVDNGKVTEPRMVNLNTALCSCKDHHKPFSPRVVVDTIFFLLVCEQTDE